MPSTGPCPGGWRLTRSPILNSSISTWARICWRKRRRATMRLLRSMSSASLSWSISIFIGVPVLRLGWRRWAPVSSGPAFVSGAVQGFWPTLAGVESQRRSMIVLARAHAPFSGFGGPVHSLTFILGVPALGLRQSGRRCRRQASLRKGRRWTLVHGYANPLTIRRFVKLAESPKVLQMLPYGRIRATRSRYWSDGAFDQARVLDRPLLSWEAPMASWRSRDVSQSISFRRWCGARRPCRIGDGQQPRSCGRLLQDGGRPAGVCRASRSPSGPRCCSARDADEPRWAGQSHRQAVTVLRAV